MVLRPSCAPTLPRLATPAQTVAIRELHFRFKITLVIPVSFSTPVKVHVVGTFVYSFYNDCNKAIDVIF